MPRGRSGSGPSYAIADRVTRIPATPDALRQRDVAPRSPTTALRASIERVLARRALRTIPARGLRQSQPSS